MANFFSQAHHRWGTLPLLRPWAVLGLLLATAGAAQAQTTTFSYTGASQTYTVPTGVTAIQVAATGASGGRYSPGYGYAYGASVQATLVVTPGEVLTVMVGGRGIDRGDGGFNGGGNSGNVSGSYRTGGGGGATDLRRTGASTGDYLTTRNALLVAGGGGGGDVTTASGGTGGTPAGGNGAGAGTPGLGATQTAPGGGGVPGTNGTGGNGASVSGNYNAGGGGGYYGGGGGSGGGGIGAGGGGGSSFVTPIGSLGSNYGVASAASDGVLAITPVTPNNALAFDGTDDYVHVSTALPATSLFTLEAWVNPTSLASGFNVLLNGDNFPTGTAHCQFLNNGQLRFTISGMNDMDSPFTVPLGRWSHVAVVYSATNQTLQFYLNGTLMGGTLAYPGGIAVASQTYSLGAWLNGSAQRFFAGRYDEIRVYNTTLTQAQVQADMFSTTAAVPASLKAYYSFDQGVAGGTNAAVTSLTDQSGSGHTGTLANFALTGTTSNWVRSLPTITGISPSVGKSGTSVSLTGTNLTDATSFAFNGTSTAAFTTPTNDYGTTIAAPAYVTTGPVSLASANLTIYNGPVFTLSNDLVVNTTTGIPADSYSSITVNSPGVGTLAGNVLVTGSTTVNSGATLNDGCAIVGGVGTFTLAAGGTLGICNTAGITASGATGAIQNTGARSFSTDASYVYNGTAAQSTGSGLPTTLRNLTTTNSSNVTLTSAATVNQVVTVGGSGNLMLNGNALTLPSSASGTALVVNAGTGVVSGNTATMQRYIDASGNTGTSGYRHYSAPVSGATVGSLTTTGFTPVVNPAYNSAANSVTVSPYPTVYGYDQSRVGSTTVGTNLSAFDQGYVSPSALTDALTVGQGYTVQMPNAALVSFTGTLNTGSQTSGSLARGTQTDAGWQLIGNPYPAPLDWGTVTSSQLSGVDAAAYVFQSTGAYTGHYASFNNGVGATTGLIAAGQGFFVRASTAGTAGSVALTNANRVTTYGATPKFQRTAADPRPLVRLSLGLGSQPATPATAQDETFVYFEQGATGGFDGQYDAYKLANPSGYYLGTAAEVPATALALGLSIDGRAPLAAGATATIPVWLSVPAGSYSLTATALLNFATLNGGTDVYLRDALTGTLTNLATTPSYTFGVTANAPSTGRFTLLIGTATPLATTSAALRQVVASLYPNPSETSNVTLTVTGLPTDVRTLDATLTDALGRPVGHYSLPATQGAARTSLPTQALARGLYLLRLAPRDAQGADLGTLPTQRLSVR